MCGIKTTTTKNAIESTTFIIEIEIKFNENKKKVIREVTHHRSSVCNELIPVFFVVLFLSFFFYL